MNPDQYVVYSPFLDDESLRPIIGKALGSKEKKMIYASKGKDPTENVDTTEEERRAFVLTDDEILLLAIARASSFLTGTGAGALPSSPGTAIRLCPTLPL